MSKYDIVNMPLRRQGAAQHGRRLATLPERGVKPMRITIHVGIFTVTIIVKKRKNRHPAR